MDDFKNEFRACLRQVNVGDRININYLGFGRGVKESFLGFGKKEYEGTIVSIYPDRISLAENLTGWTLPEKEIGPLTFWGLNNLEKNETGTALDKTHIGDLVELSYESSAFGIVVYRGYISVLDRNGIWLSHISPFLDLKEWPFRYKLLGRFDFWDQVRVSSILSCNIVKEDMQTVVSKDF